MSWDYMRGTTTMTQLEMVATTHWLEALWDAKLQRYVLKTMPDPDANVIIEV